MHACERHKVKYCAWLFCSLTLDQMFFNAKMEKSLKNDFHCSEVQNECKYYSKRSIYMYINILTKNEWVISKLLFFVTCSDLFLWAKKKCPPSKSSLRYITALKETEKQTSQHWKIIHVITKFGKHYNTEITTHALMWHKHSG